MPVAGDLASGGADFGWHGVAFGDDGASLGFGDDAAAVSRSTWGAPLRRQAAIRVSRTAASVQTVESWCLPSSMSRW